MENADEVKRIILINSIIRLRDQISRWGAIGDSVTREDLEELDTETLNWVLKRLRRVARVIFPKVW